MAYISVDVDLEEFDTSEILAEAEHRLRHGKLRAREEKAVCLLAKTLNQYYKETTAQFETTPFEDEVIKIGQALNNLTWSELDSLKVLLKEQFKIII